MSGVGISYDWEKRTSERYFQHKKIKYVSPSSRAIFCLFYTNEISTSNIITFSYSFLKWQNSAIKVVTSRDFSKSSWTFFKPGKLYWCENLVLFSLRKSVVTVVSLHVKAILWMKVLMNWLHLSGKLSCNWLIVFVTMATSISSHVKSKKISSLCGIKICMIF